jgi:hypothetical protein
MAGVGQVWPSLVQDFQTQFDDTWHQVVAQQLDQRFAGTYELKNVKGAYFRIDLYGSSTDVMREVTDRAGPSQPSNIPTGQRWLRPRPYDKTTIYDEFDPVALGELPDPEGPAIMTHATVANRNKDIVLINGATGTNFTGPNGTTQVQLLAANQIAVTFGNGSVNIGMTLKKMTQARYVLDSNEVPQMDRFLGYSAKQLNNLLTNVDQVANYLYNDVKALVDGKIQRFLGFDFKLTQLLPVTSAGIRTCIFWQKRFLKMGIGSDTRTHVDVIATQKHALQIRTVMLLDLTRTEEAGVGTIASDETV